MWPNGYTTCFYNPHVDVRHLKDATLVVVLMTIHISVDIEISWYHCITPNQTSDHEDCLL